MGLLDSLFGGGTKLDLKLDTQMIPEGGTLAGTISLSGGKKPLKLSALKVRLVFVNVTTVPGQSLPKIEMQVLLDNTVVANQDLPPASLNKYPFSFQVPKGTDPAGAYKVIAYADIPSVKDPQADADLKVVAPSGNKRGLMDVLKGRPGKEDVLGQFPGLMSRDDEELCDALHELQLAGYDQENDFSAVAGYLIERMRQSDSDRVKAAALAAWGNILNNRAQPEHIQLLVTFASEPNLSSRMLREVASVAAKFAEEGALPLVQQLCRNPDPEVRAEMAQRLHFDADDSLKGRKELLLSMVDDPDAGVRRNVFSALSKYTDDRQLMEQVARRASTDPSPDVQSACLSALCLSHHNGMTDLVFSTYQQHLGNPHAQVRKELAESLHWLPEDARLNAIVGGLLSDKTQEVRRAMAWQSCNMGEHPELKDLFMRAAVNDADEEVRGDALRGMTRLMPVTEAVPFLRQRLQQDPTESTHRGALEALRDHSGEPSAHALLTELSKAPFARVAQRAREVLEG